MSLCEQYELFSNVRRKRRNHNRKIWKLSNSFTSGHLIIHDEMRGKRVNLLLFNVVSSKALVWNLRCWSDCKMNSNVVFKAYWMDPFAFYGFFYLLFFSCRNHFIGSQEITGASSCRSPQKVTHIF